MSIGKGSILSQLPLLSLTCMCVCYVAYPDYSQPYQAIPATPFQQHQSSHPMSNSSQALYQVQSAYPTQPTYPSRSQQQPQSDFQSQPHSQAAITAQYSTPYTSQPASRTPTAPGSSEPFSIDAWLTTAIGVPSAGPSVSQNQGSGAKSGYTSPQESKYLPPQRRSPPVTPGAQASSGAVKGPPGFGW